MALSTAQPLHSDVDSSDDQMEMLAASGGIQITDRIELAEYRAVDDDLRRPLLFRIAGMKYHPEQPRIEPGETLELYREPHNAHDNHATFVLGKGAVRLGYVPRQYSQLIASLLDAGERVETVVVRELIVPMDAVGTC